MTARNAATGGSQMRRLVIAAVTCLVAALAAPAGAQAPHQKGAAFNMVVVGHDDLGGRGFNADVWVHEEHAYVGSWGFSDFAQWLQGPLLPGP